MADETKTTTTSTDTSSTNGLTSLNESRVNTINDMYAKQKENSLSQLKTAYDQNMSDAQAAYDKISPQYQTSMNELAAEYERQKRNNNMQAAGNGLNTGAGSQMNLAQSASYQQGQGSLKEKENEALDDANKNILDLKTTYQNDITSAISSNDYQLAAALLDEYNNAYTRQTEQAKALAEFGDFSGYTGIWSDTQIQQAQKSWALQNPDLAYTTGALTADEYFSMTGKWPNGYTDPNASSGDSGGGGSYDANYAYNYRNSNGSSDTGNSITLTTPGGSTYTATGSTASEASKNASATNNYMNSASNLIWYRNS